MDSPLNDKLELIYELHLGVRRYTIETPHIAKTRRIINELIALYNEQPLPLTVFPLHEQSGARRIMETVTSYLRVYDVSLVAMFRRDGGPEQLCSDLEEACNALRNITLYTNATDN